MRLSIPLSYSGSFKSSVSEVLLYEKAGLDIVWVAEAYGYDSVSLMGYLAAMTERVEIGSGIMPIYSRTPALIAQSAVGLDEVSNGRFILGLGASGPQVIESWHGVSYDKPLNRTKEIIGICRRIWAGERLESSGLYQLPLLRDGDSGQGRSLKLLVHPLRQKIPIFVASIGPRNVEMTAELAEGWLPIFFIPEKVKEVWGDSLSKGLSRRSQDLTRLECVGGGPLAIGERVEHLLDESRPNVALYVGGMGGKGRNFYNDLFRRYGFDKEAAIIQDLYLQGKKREAAAAVPEEFLRQTSLIGPKAHVEERVAAFKEAGVTILNVTPVGSNPLKSFETLKEMLS